MVRFHDTIAGLLSDQSATRVQPEDFGTRPRQRDDGDAPALAAREA